MRILVTGGAGFIGSHVCEKLVEKGHELIIVDNMSTGIESNVPDNCLLFKIDIRSKIALHALLRFSKKIDAVIHLAAQTQVSNSISNPEEDASENIIGIINVLETMKQFDIPKIIFASSAAVYGNKEQIPIEEYSIPEPTSQYGTSKLSSEEYIKTYSRLYGIEYCIFRFSNVFGPRQNIDTGGVIAKFLDKINNNQPIMIYGDGNQTRDFIYVKDVASAIEHSLIKIATGTYNLSTGTETSINDLSNLMKEFKDFKIQFKPEQPGDIYKSSLGNKKLICSRWKPHYSLEEALEETFNYTNGGNINDKSS